LKVIKAIIINMDWVIQSLPKELTNENIKKIQIVSKINRPF